MFKFLESATTEAKAEAESDLQVFEIKIIFTHKFGNKSVFSFIIMFVNYLDFDEEILCWPKISHVRAWVPWPFTTQPSPSTTPLPSCTTYCHSVSPLRHHLHHTITLQHPIATLYNPTPTLQHPIA